MPKHMSKTLAAEIADRTLQVVNPQNRPMALMATLQRHGFTPGAAPAAGELGDRAAIIGWLIANYAQRD